jgi:hypothetical protein
MSDIKPGDLVIVIGGGRANDGNAGRTGTVIRHITPGHYNNIFPGVYVQISEACWLVEASHGFNQVIETNSPPPFDHIMKTGLPQAVFRAVRLKKIGGPSIDTTETTSKPIKEIA